MPASSPAREPTPFFLRGGLSVLVLWLMPNFACAQAFRHWIGHSGPVVGIAFRSDGRLVASASFDHTVKIQTLSDTEQQTLTGHQAKVSALAWSPDGRLAAGSIDGTVRVWDLATGFSSPVPGNHVCAVHGVTFSPDGGKLLSCGEDGQVLIRDVATGTLERLDGTGPLYALAISPDGRVLATGGLAGVILYDLASGEILMSLEGYAAVYALTFGPGNTLAAGFGDQTVRLWDVETGEQLLCLEGHEEAVAHVAFSGPRRLVSASLGGQIVLWDAKTGAALFSHRFPDRTPCAAVSPDGTAVAVGTDQGTCYLMELPPHLR